VEICQIEICAMLLTKGSSTYAKAHVQEEEGSIVNEYNVMFYN